MPTAVVLTGGLGFLGRHLARGLVSAGLEVHALPHAEADVTSHGQLLSHARPAQAVVHLAFMTQHADRQAKPFEALLVAAAGTANALRLAQACGARHFLLASSGKVYGHAERLPTPEETPLLPTTFLGELKLLQESIVRTGVSHQACPMGATLLRLFNVYGPGAPAGFFLPRLLAGLGSGSTVAVGELDHRRDWLHVEDACSAFLTALRTPPDVGQVRALNAGTGQSLSGRDWLDLLEQATGSRPVVAQEASRLRAEEPAEERADWRCLGALGWKPTIDALRGALSLVRPFT